MCICILSYYTYSGTEYSDDHLYSFTWVLTVFIYLFIPSAPPLGCLVHPLGEDTLLVHPIEVYPYNCLDFRLKSAVNAVALIHVSNCATFVNTACIHVWALIGTLSYYFEGFPDWWHHGNTPVMSSGVGIPSPTANKLWYWQQYPFIYLI